MIVRTYRELIRIEDYYERFEYVRLAGKIGEQTFGWERYLNQYLYRSAKWKRFRNEIIIRDNGCDLAHPDFPIVGPKDFGRNGARNYNRIIVHHLNPLTPEEVEEDSSRIYDPEEVVCVALMTHNAIHYGDETLLPALPLERRAGDTCPWR